MSATPMTTAAPGTAPEVETPVAPKADAEKTTSEIFKWSAWVNVGDGAEDCPNARNGNCDIEHHFHAWVRLPNPFQVRDIVEKAKAAQARKYRELRDPDSDAAIILEDELDQIRQGGEIAKDAIVDELLGTEWAEMRHRAERETAELDDESWTPTEKDDEGDRPKLWAHIDQDREELQRLQAAPEGERDEEQISKLESRLSAYEGAVSKRQDEIEAERRAHYEGRDLDDLLAIVKRDRIEVLATEIYLHTYATWQWFVCTFKPKAKGTPNERMWRDLHTMKYEAPSDVIVTLRATFEELEDQMRSRRAGKGS